MSADRAATILARFTATYSTFTSKLRDLPSGIAEEKPDPHSWSPTQIGSHVAMVNEWIAEVLNGSASLAEPQPAGFQETFDATGLPPTQETFPTLVPPARVGHDAVLERLRTSSQHLTKAIASLSSDRGAGYTVRLNFGTLSLFELADYAATHMKRHLAQVDRTVGARV